MRGGVWFWGMALVVGAPVEAAAEPESGAVSVSVSAPESVPESAPVSVSAPVLLVGVQGSVGVRHAYEERLGGALGDALVDRGYTVVADSRKGEALVACGALECIEQTLDGAGAVFAVVPAMWVRQGDRRELTLTLVGKSGRNLNAGTVINGDLRSTAMALLDELLGRRAELDGDGDEWAADGLEIAAADGTTEGQTAAPRHQPAHPHAWKTGPIVLLAGGAAIFIGVGVRAGIRDSAQQLNKGAVAAWTVVGAAGLAGGTAWWIVGAKRRRGPGARSGSADTAIRVSPSGFDLRLRF